MDGVGSGGWIPPNAIKGGAPTHHVHVHPKGENAVESVGDGPEKWERAISANDGVGSAVVLILQIRMGMTL